MATKRLKGHHFLEHRIGFGACALKTDEKVAQNFYTWQIERSAS
jgi:hypothetical protein